MTYATKNLATKEHTHTHKYMDDYSLLVVTLSASSIVMVLASLFTFDSIDKSSSWGASPPVGGNDHPVVPPPDIVPPERFDLIK